MMSLLETAGSTICFFGEDLVLLASSDLDLQHALDRFSAVCKQRGMNISTKKTEALCVSRNSRQCMLQVSGITLQQVEKFKYLGVVFTSDGRRNRRLIRSLVKRTGKTNTVLGKLYRSVVTKRKLWNTRCSKLLNQPLFKSSSAFMNLRQWLKECYLKWKLQRWELLGRVQGVTLLYKIGSCEIRIAFFESFLRIERSQLRWLDQLTRMSQERLPRWVLLAVPVGKRPRGRPKTK